MKLQYTIFSLCRNLQHDNTFFKCSVTVFCSANQMLAIRCSLLMQSWCLLWENELYCYVIQHAEYKYTNE